jgi:antirestriction protein ArdC
MKALESRDLDERIAEAQKIVDELRVPVTHGGDKAYYSPSRDRIQMPERVAFGSDGDYMSVLLHECAHSTGHSSRLNRKFGERFGDPGYALEELRAEMASFDMCRRTGVPFNPDDHVQYVNSWIEALQNDPREILRAAQDVEKILTLMKVPEIQYEKVPVIEQKKEQAIELPDAKASLDRMRGRTRAKGQEQTLSL